jgi:hypothetical protein
MSGPRKAKADVMPEAEVSLRLALWLLNRAKQKSHAEIAIDGAHVRIKAHEQAGQGIEERIVFDIRRFLAANRCHPQDLTDEWRGTYNFEGHTLRIRSVPGFDVHVKCDAKEIRAECKGGPLRPVKGRRISQRFADAIGQVIVAGSDSEIEELWVAVPYSTSFANVGARITKSPAFAKTGIKIALVSKTGVRLLN